MSWVLYEYKNCSTCRRARKWLDAEGVTYEVIPIVESPPSAAELARIRSLADVPSKKLFNTSGQSYRGGGFKERLPEMDEDARMEALAADGKLIKRPLLVGRETALVGFKPAEWSAAVR